MLRFLVLVGTFSLVLAPTFAYDNVKEKGWHGKAFLKEILFFIIIPFLISFLCFSFDFWAEKGIISLKIKNFYIVENIDYILFYLSIWCILSMIISGIVAIINHFQISDLYRIKQFPAWIYTMFFCTLFVITYSSIPKYTNSTLFKYIIYPVDAEDEDIVEMNKSRVTYVVDGVEVYYYDDSKYYHVSDFCPELDKEDEKHGEYEHYNKVDYKKVSKSHKPCEVCVPQKGKPIPEYDF